MSDQDTRRRIREILALNAQKGAPYIVRFRDDPVDYVGIPVLHGELDSSEDDVFSFRVSAPPEKAGMLRRSIDDIESIEPE
jgi:hypothetical protein